MCEDTFQSGTAVFPIQQEMNCLHPEPGKKFCQKDVKLANQHFPVCSPIKKSHCSP